MAYAIFHWHEAWHIIVSIGGFILWILWRLLEAAWLPSDVGRIEAERRGRERIMESYDKYDRQDD
jgi:hypothetical protein